jgi:small subunit ribosomal protein S18
LSNEENWNDEQRSPGARGQRARRTQGRRFIPRRKVCVFCTDKIDVIDYKRPEILRRFLTDRGKIRPRRRTGTCAKHQRRLAVAIKRARHLALLPYVAEHLRRYG